MGAMQVNDSPLARLLFGIPSFVGDRLRAARSEQEQGSQPAPITGVIPPSSDQLSGGAPYRPMPTAPGQQQPIFSLEEINRLLKNLQGPGSAY